MLLWSVSGWFQNSESKTLTISFEPVKQIIHCWSETRQNETKTEEKPIHQDQNWCSQLTRLKFVKEQNVSLILFSYSEIQADLLDFQNKMYKSVSIL